MTQIRSLKRQECLQNAQTARRLHSRSCLRNCRPMRARQSNGELGELADPAIDGDGAAVLLRHDVIADREAKAGAFAGRLGRKERLEELVLDLSSNSDAVVAHPHLDHIAEVSGRHL